MSICVLFQFEEPPIAASSRLRQDSRASSEGGGNTDQSSWEFRSALEAPIARLESLDELETTTSSGALPVILFF